MALQLQKTDFYQAWSAFSRNRGILECDFFDPEDGKVIDLLGDFSVGRLTAFGEHASGSVIGFYSKDNTAIIDAVPVCWLDSEGAPCIVVSSNLKEFLSVLPYGMGFVYTVAAVIENNLREPDILAKAKARVPKNGEQLLAEVKQRFMDVDILLEWLSQNAIQVSDDPVQLIVNAHESNNDLTNWIAENLI